MAGRIGDDELALVGGEEAICDVDGDALFAFGFEAVKQEREVDVLALGAMLDRISLKSGELVFEDQLGVIEQTSDQRGLAVVHRAAGKKAQHALFSGGKFPDRGALGFGRIAEGRDLGGHQKYPSRFFFSIDPLSSWSIRRPERSEVRAVSISPTMSSSVAASLSKAAVSG